MWAGGCGPGPQDNVDVQDRACGPLQPCVLTLMVSPRDQSTLRTLLGREPGAPSLGLVGEQRGAHLPVGQPPPPDGLDCRAETGHLPIPEPALGLGPSLESRSSGRCVLRPLPGGQAVGHL